jgi:hypothetical protein
MRTAVGIARPAVPSGASGFLKHHHCRGPDMHELMPDVMEERIEPGLVFDRTTNIDGVPMAIAR